MRVNGPCIFRMEISKRPWIGFAVIWMTPIIIQVRSYLAKNNPNPNFCASLQIVISAFEPPKKESESPTVNPPSSEQLSTLPDSFKLFTAEVLNAQVKMPNQASKIYKDECVLTCDTVYSPKGLFVCLKTFYSYGNRFIRMLSRHCSIRLAWKRYI